MLFHKKKQSAKSKSSSSSNHQPPSAGPIESPSPALPCENARSEANKQEILDQIRKDNEKERLSIEKEMEVLAGNQAPLNLFRRAQAMTVLEDMLQATIFINDMFRAFDAENRPEAVKISHNLYRWLQSRLKEKGALLVEYYGLKVQDSEFDQKIDIAWETLLDEETYVSAKVARVLTWMDWSSLSRLCKAGKIRSKQVAGRRRNIHLGDLARYMVDRNSNKADQESN